jgi:predicted nucleic acid-binding protein
MLYYFDSSALVKRYAPETGSVWIKQLFNPPLTNQIYCAQVTGIEVAAGLSRKVRTKQISPKYYQLVLQLFTEDLDKGDYNLVPLSDDIVKRAIDLTQHYPLRAYDALHLATAASLSAALVGAKLPPITFVCADTTLLAAAQDEGLAIDNPNLH